MSFKSHKAASFCPLLEMLGRQKKAALVPLFMLCIANNSPAEPIGLYEESDGQVIFEAEATPSDKGNWRIGSNLHGYSGQGYLEFLGNTHQGGPATSPLAYNFTIREAGDYVLDLRCAKRAINGQHDLANDVYVRMVGDFESPAGDGDDPDIPDSYASTHMLKSDTKFYCGKTDRWDWSKGDARDGLTTGRLDPGGRSNKRKAVYRFKAGQSYTLIVSGRSRETRLDSIALRKVGTEVRHDAIPSRVVQGLPPQDTDADRVITSEELLTSSPAAEKSTTTSIRGGEWLKYPNFRFDAFQGGRIDLVAASEADEQWIDLRLGTPSGQLLGSVHVRPTGGTDHWTMFGGAIASFNGTADLYLVARGKAEAPVALKELVLRSGERFQAPLALPPIRPPAGRMAIVSDGNSPDPDDISGIAASLAMLRVAGLDHRVVHISNSCDLDPASNIPPARELERQQLMQDAAEGARERWGGYEGLTFWNCRTQLDATVADLAKAIDASSAEDPLWIVEAGEPDVIVFALRAAQEEKRQFVNLVTHHPVNDHSGDFVTFADLLALGVRVVRIPDQNGATYARIGQGLQRQKWAFDWARDSDDPKLNWLWSLIDFVEKDDVVGFQRGKSDISDAGMILYWITGADVNNGYATPTVYDVKDLFDNPAGAPSRGL